MDYFGRDQLKELFQIDTAPAVSIYMETHRTGAEVAAQPLRLRAAIEEARGLLGDANDGAGDVLAPLEALISDQDFWRHQADGLALFASRGFGRLYRLPVRLPDLVVVGPTFHTRPLIEFLQAPERFWVLLVAQKEVRMWEGTVSDLAPVDLTTVPKTLQEALGTEVVPGRLNLHSPRGTGSAPIFHGHGAGKDDTKQELEKFFRAVDAGVREYLADEIGPVILAAVDYYHPIYRHVSKLENLADEGIVGNIAGWDEGRIHASAWPIARKSVERKLEKAIDLWESSFGRGKTESDLTVAARLAVAGRIRLLLTEKGRAVWGRIDRRTGDVEVVAEGGPDPYGDTVDLFDELAEITIQYGGRALELPGEKMPSDTGLAVVLR
ncbi:MAG: hypothetical protein Q8W45_02455 [Candidatus Palauibacterales bacterium]|nr:hypothetical protein [Candidatus Palauibacterales bacterium]MDP2482118.1 hypothetical protein [Candidatus Palauibacterales bacterium]